MTDGKPTAYAGSLSFLLSQLGAVSARMFAERLAPLGVSPRAYGVLSNLARGTTQTQQQLADALGIHRNNMVGLIDEMEAAGWVQRHRNAHDRRAYDVRLTDNGSALVSRVDQVLPDLEADLACALDPAERQSVIALLEQMSSALGLSPGVHPHLGAPSARRPQGEPISSTS